MYFLVCPSQSAYPSDGTSCMSVRKDNRSYFVVYETDTPRSLSCGRPRTRGLNVTKCMQRSGRRSVGRRPWGNLACVENWERAVRLAVAGRPVALTSKSDL